MKSRLSVRVEVEVDVEDEAELNTFWGRPVIIHSATVLRRVNR
jgi:hypothetical protein